MTTQEAAAERSTPRLLRLNEVADRLAVSRRYLDELVREGRLRAVKVGPGTKMVRVRNSDLRAFCSHLPAVTAGAA